MKKSNLLFASIPLLALLIGCGTQLTSEPQGSQATAVPLKANQKQELNGDIEETTASSTTLPSFLEQADPKIINAYQLAAQNLDLLQYIPCYCGCGQSAGHKSNADCFVRGKTADGKIIWDDHGTRCDTCMDIAVTAAKLKQQGKSVLEIRQIIDNKYKEGYAKPTPTPLPQSS